MKRKYLLPYISLKEEEEKSILKWNNVYIIYISLLLMQLVRWLDQSRIELNKFGPGSGVCNNQHYVYVPLLNFDPISKFHTKNGAIRNGFLCWLTLYPRYVNSNASANDIKAKNICTAHNSVGRFTQTIASQFIIGRSWKASSVNVDDSRNSVLFPTVQPKLCRTKARHRPIRISKVEGNYVNSMFVEKNKI